MEPRAERGYGFEICAVAVAWLVFSFVQSPIPGINEPHYLCKAKHFWDASYCPGDRFLDSDDTHFVFYLTFGWITRFTSLETTAAIGRIVSLGLLAWGWTALVRALLPRPGTAFLAASAFLAYSSWQIEWFGWNGFSGEWIVGGVESKVVSWGCLFLGVAESIRSRPLRAALAVGVAIGFHPIVGIWGAAALAGSQWINRRAASETLPNSVAAWKLLAVSIAAALPGLIPAASTALRASENPSLADRIQVFERLGHHLNPLQFPMGVYILYAGLLGFWWLTVWLAARRKEAATRFARGVWFWFVMNSAMIALAGILVGLLQLAPLSDDFARWQARLLKFYPFRMADILVPLAVVIACVDLATRSPATRGRTLAAGLAGLVLLAVSLGTEPRTRNPEGYTTEQRAAWIDVCGWIDGHLPPDALVIVPRNELTFKWYAARGTYVTNKDAPQDANGLLEWDRRRRVLDDWYRNNYDDSLYSREELHELRTVTGATHLLARRLGPLEPEPVYRNAWYRVYELPAGE